MKFFLIASLSLLLVVMVVDCTVFGSDKSSDFGIDAGIGLVKKETENFGFPNGGGKGKGDGCQGGYGQGGHGGGPKLPTGGSGCGTC